MKDTAPPGRGVNADDKRLALAHARGLLGGHLDRLRHLPAHGNTRLGADQLFLGLLLAFFEPMARSLRLIECCGDFGGRLDLTRMARSTTADALAAFDPEHLRPLIEDLRARRPGLGRADADLAGITRRIVAADGTYLNTVADVAWALHQTRRDGRRHGQVRANVQLDVAAWVPRVVTVSGDDGQSEPAASAKDLLEGVLYVVDRNFLDFGFVRQLLERGNDLVLRVRGNALRGNAPAVRVLGGRALSAADAEAGVAADELVELTGRDAPAGVFRRVTILTTDRRGGPEAVLLLTNLTGDRVAAHVVGAAYRLRWQVELFFKWLKCWARMDHLLSTSRRGITTQLYVAVIAVLIMHAQTGRRVSVYALAALGRVAAGRMTVRQAMDVIARRERERELARARQARLRRRKKLA